MVLKFAPDAPMSDVIERVGVHVWMNLALGAGVAVFLYIRHFEG
jgi:hypothetical protein